MSGIIQKFMDGQAAEFLAEEGATSQAGGGVGTTAPQTIVVDGKVLTVADIQELHIKAQMGENYTKKTMRLGEERRELERQKAELNRLRQQNNAGIVEKEENSDTDPVVAAVVKPIQDLTAELRADRDSQKKNADEAVKAAHVKAVDEAFDFADEVMKEEAFALASPTAVGARIRTFWETRGKIPTQAEIRALIAAEHQSIAAKGVTLVKKEVVGETSSDGSTKPSVGAGTGAGAPIVRTAPKQSLFDDDKVEAALKSFVQDRLVQ